MLLRLQDWLLGTALYPFALRLGMELHHKLQGTQSRPTLPKSWQPVVPLPDYERYLRRIVEVGRSRGAEVWFITAPDALSLAGGLKRYDALPANARARRVLAFNAHKTFAELLEIHERYRQSTRQVARELGVPLIDAALAYQTFDPAALFDDGDVVHPLPFGHEIEARLLLERLRVSGVLESLRQ